MPGFLNLNGLSLNTEQGKWRRTAQAVAAEILAPRAAEVDATASFPKDNMRALGDAGLLSLLVPKEYGGAGQDIVAAVAVTEALAKGCASTAMAYQMHQSTIPLMTALVDEAQAERIFRPISQGKSFGAFAMSEPGSGNRIWHMDSFAVRDGDHYVIDSMKSFCTSSGEADFYLLPVRSREGATKNDLSLFFIEGDTPNIKPIGEWDAMGLRGNRSRPIHFDNVRVPVGNRIGNEDEGLSFMMAYALPIYLCGIAACYIGISQLAYETAVEHVKKRIHSDTGKSLAHVEHVQRLVAEMRIDIDVTRATTIRYAQMADNSLVLFNEFKDSELLDDVMRDNPDDPFFIEVASLKPRSCEMAIDVSNKALQVCGGAGYKRGHPVERCYRDARAGSVMGPADDTAKIVIGTQILGLPQPWI